MGRNNLRLVPLRADPTKRPGGVTKEHKNVELFPPVLIGKRAQTSVGGRGGGEKEEARLIWWSCPLSPSSSPYLSKQWGGWAIGLARLQCLCLTYDANPRRGEVMIAIDWSPQPFHTYSTYQQLATFGLGFDLPPPPPHHYPRAAQTQQCRLVRYC